MLSAAALVSILIPAEQNMFHGQRYCTTGDILVFTSLEFFLLALAFSFSQQLVEDVFCCGQWTHPVSSMSHDGRLFSIW